MLFKPIPIVPISIAYHITSVLAALYLTLCVKKSPGKILRISVQLGNHAFDQIGEADMTHVTMSEVEPEVENTSGVTMGNPLGHRQHN